MIERKIIERHGISKIEDILEKVSAFDDCTFIAINQKEVSAIVYQSDKRPIMADHMNGDGARATRYKNITELRKDLDDLSYWLVNLLLLKKEIELQKLREQLELKVLPSEGKKIKQLKQLCNQMSEIIEG
nr:hypothetical protein [uncultured Acinetobacter sp.]